MRRGVILAGLVVAVLLVATIAVLLTRDAGVAAVEPQVSPAAGITGAPLEVRGVGFGAPGPDKAITVPLNSTSTTFASTDARVQWTDTSIRIDSDAFTSGAITVKLDRTSLTTNVAMYSYDWFDVLPVSFLRAPPLAVAVDDAGRVWINQEFHIQTFQVIEDGTVRRIEVPRPDEPPFGSSFDPDNMTHASALGEDVLVDPQGTVWFTQGGSSLYTGNTSNHARVVAYDPDAPEGQRSRVYTLPGDQNEAIGLEWDDARQRIWVAQAGFDAGAALISFAPDTVTADGSWCTDGDPIATCYQRFDMPRSTTRPSHLVVDDAGHVWTTLMWGNAIARLDPATGDVTEYPLPPQSSRFDWLFGGAPWEIKIHDGYVVWTEFVDATIGRMAIAEGDQAHCTRLKDGRNPCMEEIDVLAGYDHADGFGLHSIAYDQGGNLWFTPTAARVEGNDLSIGYVTPDWQDIVMLPPLRQFSADGPVHSAGIAIGPDGDIWFAEFERRRIGRLTPVS